MLINKCSKYDNKKSKKYNNDKVAYGWRLTEVDWKKEDIVELTTKHGISGNEYKGDHKVKDDWVATHAIMLDFDDGSMTVDDLLSMQKKWKYDSYVYNSQNHQKDKIDSDGKIVPACARLRALIPLSEPIRSEIDRKAVEKALILHFKKSDKNLDATFLGKARYFAHGGIMISSFVGDKGSMDWTKIPGLKYKKKRKVGRPSKQDSLNDTFRLDTEVKDKDGEILKISDIDEKTIIFCPICGDAPYRSNDAHNAFVDINDDGLPFIYCSSCDARDMGVSGKGIYNIHPDDAYDLKTKDNEAAVVFIDTLGSKYYAGCVENGIDELVFRSLSTLDHVEQFRKAHDLPEPYAYPRARYELVFDSDVIKNFKGGYVNKYIAPDVLTKPMPAGHTAQLPEYIGKLIDHVLAHDANVIEHFYNDIAHFIQTRQKMITSYLFQGTQGTGKNLLFENVFMRILGEQYCSTTDQDAFGNQFNSFLTDNVLVLVSEVSGNFSSSDRKNLSTIEKMKIAITDKHVQIEGKGDNRYNGRNNCSFIFATNRHHGLVLSKDDRRFNVAPRQESKIHYAQWWPGYKQLIKLIDDELQEFVWYLKQRKVNDDEIGIALDNKPKKILQAMSTTDAEDFFDAVNTGDVSWFKDNVMQKDGYNGDEKYIKMLALISRLAGLDKTSTNELCQLYNYLNNKNLSVQLFTKLAKQHLKAEIKQMRRSSERIQGVEIIWNDEDDIFK